MSLLKGRFNKGNVDAARKLSESISFDKVLYEEDIEGSKAHARMLAKQGIISESAMKKIIKGLEKIKSEITEGKFCFKEELEDIHMNIEAALIEKIGEDGAKLHTARSRNDQVNLDTRLYVRKHYKIIKAGILELQRAFLEKAVQYKDLLMPGFTHLQHAQVILFSHLCLAYIEMFQRDIERLDDAIKRIDVSPLGSGAIAGTTLPIDRQFTAKELGFSNISRNSIDAVSDRDFVCEFLSVLAIFGMHISRISEDLVIFSSQEFSYISIGEEFCTGSSLMPQKRNPDMAELSRGKAGRLYGNLMAVLTVCKGLANAYNRDLQEDKEALFDSVETVEKILSVYPDMIRSIKCNEDRMKEAVKDPSLIATDLAEALVVCGVPFREAYKRIANLVKEAEKLGVALDKLPDDLLNEIVPELADKYRSFFNQKASADKRGSYGGTSLAEVNKQIKYWQKKLMEKK